MLSDEISTRSAATERRELGMLTLQLRQAVSEAEAAEAESAADAIDLEAADSASAPHGWKRFVDFRLGVVAQPLARPPRARAACS